jgi:hypothetical protein
MTVDSNNSNSQQIVSSCNETNFADAINQAVIQGIGFGLGGIVVVLVMKWLKVRT